jgi:hypothetical protein
MSDDIVAFSHLSSVTPFMYVKGMIEDIPKLHPQHFFPPWIPHGMKCNRGQQSLTFLTQAGCFSNVNSLMHLKVFGVPDSFFTFITLTGFLFSDSFHICECSCNCWRFSTLLTHVRFLLCVNYFMLSKGREPTEGFPTLLTHIRFLSYVYSFMFLKVNGSKAGFHTFLTYIWLFSWVNYFVL